MKDYNIDAIGKMEFLTNLQCFCSSKEYSEHHITICIHTTNQEIAKNLHTFIHTTVKGILHFDQKAKEKLKSLYNSTDKELLEISINHIDFYPNKEFDLLYNLPEGSPIEYLSVKLSKNGSIIDTGGGNY